MAIGHRDYRNAHSLIDDYVDELTREIEEKGKEIERLTNKVESLEDEVSALNDMLKEKE